MYDRHRPHRVGILGLAAMVLISATVLALFSSSSGGLPGSPTPLPVHVAAATPVSIPTFSFQPNPVSQGSTTSGTVTLSGGTSPYYLWFNSTPPGCNPPGSPTISSSTTFQFNCQPSASGSFNIHLDVTDSSSPVGHASRAVTLSVNSNSGNNNNGSGNNNGGGGSNGSFSLPSGLLQLVFIVAVVFLAAMVAMAAGMVATAVAVSRRLRQINETLARSGTPPKDPKAPT
ncbi:MAG TPA: hypothetical protein VEY07_08530 [Thermoplasmata archaeon]|nr:hypothetical protein [Thermoplasmata archaeon]